MTIIDKHTLVYYEMLAINIQRDESDIVATADIAVLNAEGQRVDIDHPSAMLTQEEKTTLAAFVNRELAVYETATGLTEWTE